MSEDKWYVKHVKVCYVSPYWVGQDPRLKKARYYIKKVKCRKIKNLSTKRKLVFGFEDGFDVKKLKYIDEVQMKYLGYVEKIQNLYKF